MKINDRQVEPMILDAQVKQHFVNLLVDTDCYQDLYVLMSYLLAEAGKERGFVKDTAPMIAYITLTSAYVRVRTIMPEAPFLNVRGMMIQVINEMGGKQDVKN